MNRNINPFGLRIPKELKTWLQQQAKLNKRSLNSEILIRLEQSKTAEVNNDKK
ncbi:MAG: Arc family DNA-binding protein [Moraxellaceae bacterium]|nr:Arc family DNA-binding protein [Moraxellaceae bacterium]